MIFYHTRKQKMLNKILFKIFGVFDVIKDFLFTWGVRVLIFIFVCVILHNLAKINEISSLYTGEYKKMYPVYDEENKFMNLYTVGEGSKTIVILPAFGSPSPAVEYKTLVEGLRNEYKVVVVEYFGYGYSMSMKNHPRTNENIAAEIKKVLELANISGPYVLMPHETSNVYAMYFQQAYPELVQGIVSIDGLYPAEIKDDYYKVQTTNRVSNVNITSIFELTGYERVLSYVKGDVFYIDKMKQMPDIYNKEDIKVYRNRIGSSYLSRTMVREINKLEDNMNEMKDYTYPDYLPVLEILAKDTVKKYEDAKKSGEANIDLKELAENTITNSEIQKIEEIKGDDIIQLSNPTDLLNSIRSFLMNF